MHVTQAALWLRGLLAVSPVDEEQNLNKWIRMGPRQRSSLPSHRTSLSYLSNFDNQPSSLWLPDPFCRSNGVWCSLTM